MGFHGLDLIFILAIGLLILGPKSVQSLSRRAGKTAAQAKEARDKLLAELPMEDLNEVRGTLSRIPLSPQQAALMLITPEQQKKPAEQTTTDAEQATTEVPQP